MHKLTPYRGRGIIAARLEEFPELSAKRLFDEVQAAGYGGGYSRVWDFVQVVRPHPPVETAVRFGAPGLSGLEWPRFRGHSISERPQTTAPPPPLDINGRTSAPPETSSPEVCSFSCHLHMPHDRLRSPCRAAAALYR